jgi:hypothetical protein
MLGFPNTTWSANGHHSQRKIPWPSCRMDYSPLRSQLVPYYWTKLNSRLGIEPSTSEPKVNRGRRKMPYDDESNIFWNLTGIIAWDENVTGFLNTSNKFPFLNLKSRAHSSEFSAAVYGFKKMPTQPTQNTCTWDRKTSWNRHFKRRASEPLSKAFVQKSTRRRQRRVFCVWRVDGTGGDVFAGSQVGK